jgi:hypothetical protein
VYILDVPFSRTRSNSLVSNENGAGQGFLPLFCIERNVASNLDSFSILCLSEKQKIVKRHIIIVQNTSHVTPRILSPLKTHYPFSPSVFFVLSLAVARVPKFRLRFRLFSYGIERNMASNIDSS